MSTNVLLIDDNSLFRQGLGALIAAHDEFSVVAHLEGRQDTVAAVLAHEPDIVLIDTMLAHGNGLHCVEQLKRRRARVRVMVVTSNFAEDHVRSALHAGADGYILKSASIDELLMAMRYVAQGKKYLSPDVSQHVVQRYLDTPRKHASPSRLDTLTTRERSILQLIAQGRTNRKTAEFLSVSHKTVEKHRASLMHKLGLRNVAELTLVALDMGLIENPLPLSRFTGRIASTHHEA